MLELEWLTSDDPLAMERWVGLRASARRARLFDVACCRRFLALNPAEPLTSIIEVAERYAEGKASGSEVAAAAQGVGGFSWVHAKQLARRAALADLTGVERRARCALLREIFGNPFRPVTVDPVWLRGNDGAAAQIARGMYDERRFEELPVLADALEDAGCTTPALLQHCRVPGEHVRGCWVLDVVLGKG